MGRKSKEWSAVLAAVRNHPDASGRDLPPPGRTKFAALPIDFTTEPKQHKDDTFLAAKQARLWEDHVAPVNRFVEVMRAELTAERGIEDGGPPVYVPYIDPDSGGIRARVLFLLESPAGPAALGSGMLSADNNDETARNVWRAYAATGLPRTAGLHWNAVPWYVGDGKRNASVKAVEVERGRQYLSRLLDLTPEVSVLLALGKPAQVSVGGARADLVARGITVIEAPHPSPISAGVTRGRSLAEFEAAVAVARDLVEN